MNLQQPPTITVTRHGKRNGSEKRLPVCWLWLARAGWIVVAVLVVILVVAGTPLEFQLNRTVCAGCNGGPQYTPQQARELANLGLSLSFYAGYLLTFELLFVIVWFLVAIVIFWRRWGKPDEPLAWFISLTLLTVGAAFPNFLNHDAQRGLLWLLAAKLVIFLGSTSIVLFLYLFPTGRFVPRWTRFLGALYVLC